MTKLVPIIRNHTIWIAAVVWLSFWPIAILLERSLLFDLVNALATCAAAGVLVGYREGLIEALSTPYRNLRRGHLLILGIYCTWGPFIAQRVWAWAWRLLGKPDSMENNAIWAWLVWVACSGAVLHLRSANAIDGRMPEPHDTRIGAWTALGLALFFVVSWLSNP